MNLTTQTCPKCAGTGYQPVIGNLYRYPCKGCNGQGEREAPLGKVWRALRHGFGNQEGY